MLQSVVDAMADLRVTLDAARAAARRQLNDASLAVERAGEQAGAAWAAWREAAQALRARES